MDAFVSDFFVWFYTLIMFSITYVSPLAAILFGVLLFRKRGRRRIAGIILLLVALIWLLFVSYSLITDGTFRLWSSNS